MARVRFKLSNGDEVSKRASSLEDAQQLARDFVNKQTPASAGGEWIERDHVYIARDAVVSVTVLSDESLVA